jgi:hypothetical protein
MNRHGHSRKSGATGHRVGEPISGDRVLVPAVDPESTWEPTHAAIAVRAYELWECRGRPHGSDQEDWFEARRQLLDGAGAFEDVASGQRRPHDFPPNAGGRPQRTPGTIAEQTREAMESEQARHAVASSRERMVDIGRGNQQAGRQGE